MIWIRRVALIAALAVVVGGWFWWDDYSARRDAQMSETASLITAKAWIASARLRDEPDRYIQYRDSLLDASGISAEDLQKFLQRFSDEPENNAEFAQQVKLKVDSLYKIEEVLRQETFDSIVVN